MILLFYRILSDPTLTNATYKDKIRDELRMIETFSYLHTYL